MKPKIIFYFIDGSAFPVEYTDINKLETHLEQIMSTSWSEGISLGHDYGFSLAHLIRYEVKR